MSNVHMNLPTVTLGAQLGTVINFLAAARQEPPVMGVVTDRWQAVQQQVFEPYGFTSEHVGTAPKSADRLPEFMQHAVPLLRGVFDQHLLSIRAGRAPLRVTQEHEITPDLLTEARKAGIVSAYVLEKFMLEAMFASGELVAAEEDSTPFPAVFAWVGGLTAAGGAGMTAAALASPPVEPIQTFVGIVLTLGGLMLVAPRIVDNLRAWAESQLK